MSFETLIKRNLIYWRDYIKPYPMIEVGNLYQAVFYGLQEEKAIESSIELLYESFEVIESTRTQNKWIDLLETLIRNNKGNFSELDQRRLKIATGFLYQINHESNQVEIILKQLDSMTSAWPEPYADMHLLIAKRAWQKNDVSRIIKHAEITVNTYEELKSNPSSSWLEANNLLGIATFLSGDVEKSQDIFHAALAGINTKLDISRIINNLAITYLYQGNYKEALILLGKAATIFYRAERKYQLAQVEFTRALIYFKQNKPKRAVSICRRMLDELSIEPISSQRLWGGLLLQTIQQSTDENISPEIINTLLQNLASPLIYKALQNKI